MMRTASVTKARGAFGLFTAESVAYLGFYAMRFPRFKHAVLTGAAVGALGPLLYYSSRPVRDYALGNGLFLWPTGVIIIVTYGDEHDFFGYTVVAISVALNIIVYAAAMALLWFVVWLIRRVATRKP
ncbi:MAG: hypothetical protein E6L07_03555 [Verrucomicrobia bacterium]|nr:MAG: hypothetical protein E6L07_03555 [Verrucomicrobiota bacterium]